MKQKNILGKHLTNLSIKMKKKIIFYKRLEHLIVKLQTIISNLETYRNLNVILLQNSIALKNLTKQNFGIVYIIHFNFSSINTFLYVTNSLGILKYKYSAGLLKFKGKQKRSKALILKSFFQELYKLQITNSLKNKVISLNLTNVGFFRYFIIKKLKNLFAVKFIKNYQMYARNGCRKKKQVRKK